VRSQAEVAIDAILEAQHIDHRHWAIDFQVDVSPASVRLFIPAVVLDGVRDRDRAVLIQPVNSLATGGGLNRMRAFRRKHAGKYCLIVVTRLAWERRVPPECYDRLFVLENLRPLGDYLSKLSATPV
jgi:hypothetical protein